MIDFLIAIVAVAIVIYTVIRRFKSSKKKRPTTKCNGTCSGCTNKCYW